MPEVPPSPPVVELPELPPFSGLAERLETLRDSPMASAVVLEAAVEGVTAPWGEADLAWLIRYPLLLVFAFEGRLADRWLDFALACDLRVAGKGAVIDAVAVSHGFAARRLELLAPGLVPAALDGAEALRRGLISRLAPAGGAFAAARALGATIASRGPVAVRLAKEGVWRGLEMPMEQALRFETDLTMLLQTTKDRAEGVRAFLEKRPPRFAGE